MTNPIPFNPAYIEWHVFHIKSPGLYRSGKWVGQERQDIVNWLTENIKGSWTFGSSASSITRPFYIKDASDAMMFKLTWMDETQKPVFPTSDDSELVDFFGKRRKPV
jgi:hypothetical protein